MRHCALLLLILFLSCAGPASDVRLRDTPLEPKYHQLEPCYQMGMAMLDLCLDAYREYQGQPNSEIADQYASECGLPIIAAYLRCTN